METQWQSDPPGMPIEMQRNRFVPEPVRDQAERVPPLPIRGLPGQCRTAGRCFQGVRSARAQISFACSEIRFASTTASFGLI
jgi:hypothetical protein